MTTERFLLALRRMVARRGMCSIIWSDNAKTFKCAKKELQSCWRILESEETRTALSEKKIQWKFIVPRAPWWGGFYERLVKSVKLPLKKIFGNAMLDAEQMTTILTEIEAQINSRPLTYIGAEPNDLKALTPAQILIGRNLQAFPSKDTKVTEHTSNALKKRLQYHQRLVNGFWKRWNAEYLKSLTTLKKWIDIGRKMHVGDVVLVSEDNVPRGQWPKARVEATHEGRDGLIRSVTLRLPSGRHTRRPVQRLHVLETCDADIAAGLK
ncbi:uncharacterized protein LOC111346002 [Paramuricea clavata]|nr:uncharacterized protein LOC111346002 [Paramuricea clavata]